MEQSVAEDFLSEKQRAEDILLGSLGYGEDAVLVSVERTTLGFKGRGAYSDGEEFFFESEDELSDLEKWALVTLLGTRD